MLLLLLPRARSDEHEHTVRRSEPRGRPRPAPPLAAPARPGAAWRPGAAPRPPERSFRSGMAGPDPRELGGSICEHSRLPGPCSSAPPLGAGARGSPSSGLWSRETGRCGTQHGGKWMHRARQALANQEIAITSWPAPAFSHPSLLRRNRIETLGWGDSFREPECERFTRRHVFTLHALGPRPFL